MRTRSTRSTDGLFSKRSTRSRVSYRESSSEDSETCLDGEDGSSLDELCKSPAPKRPRLRKPKAKSLRSKQPVSDAGVISNQSHKTSLKDVKQSLDSLEKIPPWQTLPYEILLQIFHYAAHPLCDDTFEATPSVGWLLKSALLCKAFAEPALSVLYYAPPLTPMRAHGLLALISSQELTPTFAYRHKIKYLDMEAMSTLVYKHGGRGPIQLRNLVQWTPQLRGIGIHLVTDQPRYNKAGSKSKTSAGRNKDRSIYREDLFLALEASKISLLSWKWNFANFSQDLTVNGLSLEAIHSYLPLHGLHSLVIVEYYDRDVTQDARLADVIRALSNLKQLSLELSSFARDFLQLLPQALESLHLIDCPTVNSENLHLFLGTHGRNLRELILNHNQYLNLAFTVDLANSCPKLQTFKMNLRYYSAFYTFQDSEPKFDSLLLPSQEPTWPASLRCLEFSYLRKWGRESAEMFFQSLLSAAADLPDLRILVVKAIVDIAWRDRANFRRQWEGRLKKVFLRNNSDPDPRLCSIQAYYSSKAQTQAGSRGLGLRPKRPLPSIQVEITRRSVGNKSQSESENENDIETGSDVEIVPKRRSKRLQEQDDCTYTPPNTSSVGIKPIVRIPKRMRETSSSIDTDQNNPDESSRQIPDENLVIQGLCNTVTVQIDNLRPTEDQFHEKDFLDEEASGDEDWNGNDAGSLKGYAW